MSVSRIGGKAQVEAMKAVAQRLKIDYARFMEVEAFTRFGARLEEESARLIRRGVRLRELLKQPRFAPCALEDQVLSFLVLESGVLDARDLAEVRTVCRDRVTVLKDLFPEIARGIREQGRLEQSDMRRIDDALPGLMEQA